MSQELAKNLKGQPPLQRLVRKKLVFRLWVVTVEERPAALNFLYGKLMTLELANPPLLLLCGRACVDSSQVHSQQEKAFLRVGDWVCSLSPGWEVESGVKPKFP